MYYTIQTKSLRRAIPMNEGIIFYWFQGFDIGRVVGGRREFSWVCQKACYREDSSGNLVFRGSFRDASPFRAAFLDFVSASNTLRVCSGMVPASSREEDFDLTARLIIESGKLFQAEFPRAEFIVLLWSGKTACEEIRNRLDAHNIRTVMVRDLLDGAENVHQTGKGLPDGHPDGVLLETIASGLVSHLRLSL